MTLRHNAVEPARLQEISARHEAHYADLLRESAFHDATADDMARIAERAGIHFSRHRDALFLRRRERARRARQNSPSDPSKEAPDAPS